MERYFNVNYEFDKNQIFTSIDDKIKNNQSGYICVADGVILNKVNHDKTYRQIINSSMFSICDSSWVPRYLKLIYGIHREYYCGPEIFRDIVSHQKYRMFFMGSTQSVLNSLQMNLIKINPNISNMTFFELPFRRVEDFDYSTIAKMIEKDKADIIWVSLGAPKQEIFMNNLLPYLERGVMIAVGAAFNFYGNKIKRPPKWVFNSRLKFMYRIFSEPKKQIRRCSQIIKSLPTLLYQEWRRKKGKDKENLL